MLMQPNVGGLLWWLGEFATALFAHMVGEKIEEGTQPGSSPQKMARHAGRILQPHFFPSKDDETAFLQAQGKLSKSEQAILTKRMDSLGVQTTSDTAEARCFRNVIVTFPEIEDRVEALRSLVRVDETTFKKIVEMTGAARAGQIDRFLKEAKDLGLRLPGIIAALARKSVEAFKRGDKQSAENIAAARQVVQDWFRQPKTADESSDLPPAVSEPEPKKHWWSRSKAPQKRGLLMSLLLGPVKPEAPKQRAPHESRPFYAVAEPPEESGDPWSM